MSISEKGGSVEPIEDRASSKTSIFSKKSSDHGSGSDKPSTPSTDCTLLQYKTGAMGSICPACLISPKSCALSMIFDKSDLRCQQSPYSLKCPSSPKYSLPPSCFLQCQPSSPCSPTCPPPIPICYRPTSPPCYSSPPACSPPCRSSPLCSPICPPQQMVCCPEPPVCCPPLPSLSANCANPSRCPRCCEVIPSPKPSPSKYEVTSLCCSPPYCPPQYPPPCPPQYPPPCPPKCSPQCLPQCSPPCPPQCPPSCSPQCPPSCLLQCSPPRPLPCQTPFPPQFPPPCPPKRLPSFLTQCSPPCLLPCQPPCPPHCPPPRPPPCSPKGLPPCLSHCSSPCLFPCQPPCPPAQCTPPCCSPCKPQPVPSAHCCSSDVESQRRCKDPQELEEFCSGQSTWDTYGVRIKWTDPEAPGMCSVWKDHPVLLKLCVEVKPSTGLTPGMVAANCWTHMKSMCNPCGRWKNIPLAFQQHASSVGEFGVSRYVYSLSVTPTETDNVKLSFNVTWGNCLVWAYASCDTM